MVRSELRYSLDRGTVQDPLGAHMFMMKYMTLNEQELAEFKDVPDKVHLVERIAGPPWDEKPLTKPLQDLARPGVDILPSQMPLLNAMLPDVTSAMQALAARKDPQPWGALICRLMDSCDLLFRPAAKVIHRMCCSCFDDPSILTDLLASALKELGYSGSLALLMICGDQASPPHPADRRVCTDLAAMGAAASASRAGRNRNQAEQAADRAREKEAQAEQAADRAREKEAQKLARQRAEKEVRDREQAEAGRVAVEELKRESEERSRKTRMRAGAVIVASAAVYTALMVKRYRSRKRSVRSW